jgi:hypothetical protein
MTDALPLLLLRDELAIDASVGDPDGASRLLPPLVGLTAAGFVAHAVCVAGTALPTLGPGPALQLGAAWALASTGGFFAAICAGLPSYGFYGVVATTRAPAWRLAVELVRVQAVGAVVLAGVVPFWLALALGLHLVFGVEVYRVTPWMQLTYALPFLCAAPGVFGLYRAFRRMRVALGHEDRLPALALTAWWVLLFLYTAPAAIRALFHALT